MEVSDSFLRGYRPLGNEDNEIIFFFSFLIYFVTTLVATGPRCHLNPEKG